MAKGRKTGGRRRTRVSVPCGICGLILERTPYQLRDSAHQFCGRHCYAAYRRTLTGERGLRWAGGFRHSNGRVLAYRPEHPQANADGYVLRYRLVMEAAIGRFLRPEEIVHHVDCDK